MEQAIEIQSSNFRINLFQKMAYTVSYETACFGMRTVCVSLIPKFAALKSIGLEFSD
jgi:hypothetical protein